MPFQKKYYLNNPDFEQRDWLLFSMQQLIENVDPNISVNIINAGKSKLLIASNITEDSISKLSFLSNSDFNNNYLYLEHFSVFLNSYNEPLNIPGLSEIVINQYRRSDIIYGFIQGKKTFQPFTSCNLGNINFNDMVDNITSIIPGCTNTKNKIKLYEIVLNPDLPIENNDSIINNDPNSSQIPSNSNINNYPNSSQIPSNSDIIDTALNNPTLALIPGVQEKRDEVNNGISTLTNFVNMLQNVKNEALDLINPAIKEAKALPGGLSKTLSDPNNIFFSSEPKNFVTNTANIISSSVNQVVKSIPPPVIPKLVIKLPPPPPPPKIKLPKFKF
jgi:hypothetical protein